MEKATIHFLVKLRRLKLPYVVAIRNNHGVLMARGQRIRAQSLASNKSGHSQTATVKSVIFVRLSLATEDRLGIGKLPQTQRLYLRRQRGL